MGNNHDKFFSKDKRKLLIVGLQGSGKSSNLIFILSINSFGENPQQRNLLSR